MEYNIKIEVPDIHCQHCKITLEGKLSSLTGVEESICKCRGENGKY